MIKVYIRAIVSTEDSFLLMSDFDAEGKEVWELPGGELKAGVDVKQYLRKIVIENTGYFLTSIQFYEIACRVRPRARGVNPLTVFDFIFTTKIESATPEIGARQTELLRHEKFEWLESDGRFRENKVMAILAKHHLRRRALDEART